MAAHLAQAVASPTAIKTIPATRRVIGAYEAATRCGVLPPCAWCLDGEIFYIIENGVRLTGMPAWGTGQASGESASWMLVHFIRHLPELSEAELQAMTRLNPVPPDEVRQRMLEEQFLESDSAPSAVPSPPASPHKH